MNAEYVIDDDFGVIYIHKADHRNRAPQKSQWTISEQQERDCFGNILGLIYMDGFGSPNGCWGLHIVAGRLAYLGESASDSSEPFRALFIAKFVDSNENDRWHGYPADHVSNTQDIPTSDWLMYWFEAGYISQSQLRKISRGQKCKL